MQQITAALSKAPCARPAAILKRLHRSNIKSVRRTLLVMEKNGLVNILRPGCYALTRLGRDALPQPADTPSTPQPNTARARTWAAIRRLRTFTVGELLVLTAKDSEGRAKSHRMNYVSALTRAGILCRMKRHTGTRYVLINDLGAKHPIMRRGKNLYDPNNKQEISYG